MLQSTIKLTPQLTRQVSLISRRNKVFEITNNNDFVTKVMNGRVPVIVNFHADWCEPCRVLTQKLKVDMGPMDKIDLAIVDVELNPELVHTFEVKAVPAIISISNGLVIDRIIGLRELDVIDNVIKKLQGQHTRPDNDSQPAEQK